MRRALPAGARGNRRVLRAGLAAATFAGVVGCDAPGSDPPERGGAGDSPLLELRLAYDEAGEGRRAVTHEGRVLHLAPEPIVSDVDFTSVEARRLGDGDSARVLATVALSPEAGERLGRATAGHLGGDLAILSRGRFLSAARIASALGGEGPYQITLALAAPEADGWIAAARDRWSAPPPEQARPSTR